MSARFERDATSDEIAKVFGATVRKLREQKGLSQDGFAFDINVNRTHYGMIERGRHVPSIYLLHRIATGLGISSSDLIALAEREWLLEH